MLSEMATKACLVKIILDSKTCISLYLVQYHQLQSQRRKSSCENIEENMINILYQLCEYGEDIYDQMDIVWDNDSMGFWGSAKCNHFAIKLPIIACL